MRDKLAAGLPTLIARLLRDRVGSRGQMAQGCPKSSAEAARIPLTNSPSEFHQFVSYLPIKPPKSLRNKDFTGKSLFLKDLGKINP